MRERARAPTQSSKSGPAAAHRTNRVQKLRNGCTGPQHPGRPRPPAARLARNTKPSQPQAHKPPTDDQHITDPNEHIRNADGLQARPRPEAGHEHPATGESGHHGREVPQPPCQNEAVALPRSRMASRRRNLRPHAQPQRAVPRMLPQSDEAPQGRATPQREGRAHGGGESEPQVRAAEHVTPGRQDTTDPVDNPTQGLDRR